MALSDIADKINSLEFVPFTVGIMYIILSATGLLITVGVVLWLVFS